MAKIGGIKNESQVYEALKSVLAKFDPGEVRLLLMTRGVQSGDPRSKMKAAAARVELSRASGGMKNNAQADWAVVKALEGENVSATEIETLAEEAELDWLGKMLTPGQGEK